MIREIDMRNAEIVLHTGAASLADCSLPRYKTHAT